MNESKEISSSNVLRVLAASGLTCACLVGVLSLMHPRSLTNGEDLIQDYLSARALLRGEDPYQDLVRMRSENGFPPTLPDPVPSNPHPPFAFFIVVPFASADYTKSYTAFVIANLLALSVAWNGAWAMFGRVTWWTAAIGGLLAGWGPVFQGLDFGQPSGFLALGVLGFWWLARRSSGIWLGVFLGLLCGIRPFFFHLSGVGSRGNWRSFMMAIAGFTAAFLIPFLLVNKSPLTWWQENGSESSKYVNICGTLPGVTRMGANGGIAFYLMSWGFLLWLSRRRDVDTVTALSLGWILLLYPLAWSHYDVIFIPGIVWMALRANRTNDRLVLWALIAYLLLRLLPSTFEQYTQRMWMQFLGRLCLVVGLSKLAWKSSPDSSATAAAGSLPTNCQPEPSTYH